METIQTNDNLTALTGSYPGKTEICPNRYNHISAFPGFDRVICPECQKVYVLGKTVRGLK